MVAINKNKGSILLLREIMGSFEYRRVRYLGRVILCFLMIAFAAPVLFRFFEATTGLGEFSDIESRSNAIRNIGIGLAAIIGLPLIIWRTYVAHRQADVAEEGHITDRISKAVDQLGNDNTAVRMGAIHSLHRILKDSPKDRVMILKTMNAFLLYRSGVSDGDTSGEIEIDVQTAMDVLVTWNEE